MERAARSSPELVIQILVVRKTSSRGRPEAATAAPTPSSLR